MEKRQPFSGFSLLSFDLKQRQEFFEALVVCGKNFKEIYHKLKENGIRKSLREVEDFYEATLSQMKNILDIWFNRVI